MSKTMRNIIFLTIVTAFLGITLNSCSLYQQQKKIPVVAIVSISHNFDPFVQGFQEEMASLGYRPGETITYLYEGPISEAELEAHLSFLKTKNIDLVYTMTTPVTKKAKELFRDTDVPILFAPVYSPVESGLVESISHPGKNITGIMTRGSTAKALEYLLNILPNIKTIFVPYHRQDMAAQFTLADLNKAAKVFGIEILTAEISNAAELSEALRTIPESADALWLTHSHLIVSNTAEIVEAAMKRNKPVASSSSQAEKGVLVSYSVESGSLGRQAGRLANKLLRGIPASQLPVERGEFYLSLNLETAHRLGISISPRMLRQANHILRAD